MKSTRRALVALVLALLASQSIAATNVPPLNLSDAIRVQQQLVERRPQNAKLANDLGNLLYLDSRLDEAEEAYRRSIEINPELASAHFNLALLLHQTERHRRAGKEFQKVVSSVRNMPGLTIS